MRTFLSFVSIILGLSLLIVATCTLTLSNVRWEFLELFSQPRVDAQLERLSEAEAFPPGSEDAYKELITDLYVSDGMILIFGAAILIGILGMVLLILGYLIHTTRSIRVMRRKVSEQQVA